MDNPPNDEPGRFKDGNTDDDGNYIVGKGRTPEGTRFRKGDGRTRGRRAKGVRNLDSYVLAEAKTTITLSENGTPVKTSKVHAMVKKEYDLGFQGNSAAIRSTLERVARAETNAAERKERSLAQDDHKIIEDYLKDRAAKAACEISGSRSASPAHPTNDDDAQEACDE